MKTQAQPPVALTSRPAVKGQKASAKPAVRRPSVASGAAAASASPPAQSNAMESEDVLETSSGPSQHAGFAPGEARTGAPAVSGPQGGIARTSAADAPPPTDASATTDAQEANDADEMAALLLAMPSIDVALETKMSRSALKAALMQMPGMAAVLDEKPWLLERLVAGDFDKIIGSRALAGEGSLTADDLAALDNVTGQVLDQLAEAWVGALDDDIARKQEELNNLQSMPGAHTAEVEAELAALVAQRETMNTQDGRASLVDALYAAHVDMGASIGRNQVDGEFIVTGGDITHLRFAGEQNDVVFVESFIQDLVAWGHKANVLSPAIEEDFKAAAEQVTQADGSLDVEAFAVAVSMRMPENRIHDQTLSRAIAWVSEGAPDDVTRRANLALQALHTAAHAKIPNTLRNRPEDLAAIEASGEQLALTLMPQFDYENGTPPSANPTNDAGRERARANIEAALEAQGHGAVRDLLDDSILLHATPEEKAQLFIKLSVGTTRRNDEAVIETILASIKTPQEMTTFLKAAGPARVWDELETHQRSFVTDLQAKGTEGKAILAAMVAAIGRGPMASALASPSPANARAMIQKAMSKKTTSNDIDDFVSEHMTLDVLVHASPAEKAHMLMGLMDGNTGESDERAVARILESVTSPQELTAVLAAAGGAAKVWDEVEGEQSKLLTTFRARGPEGQALIDTLVDLTDSKTILGRFTMVEGAVERTLEHGMRQGVLDNPLNVDVMGPSDTPQKNLRRDATAAAEDVLAFTAGKVPVSTQAAAAALKLRFPNLDPQEMWGAIAFVNRAENSHEAKTRMADVILAFQIRDTVGVPPRQADFKEDDFIELAPEVEKWRSFLGPQDWQDLVERVGVPGTHHFELGSKRHLFITFDENGRVTDVDTDKENIAEAFMDRYGEIVTVLSLVPSPIQPFVAAANAAYSAYKAYENGDVLGALVGGAAAVAGLGNATEIFSKGVQASLNAVAGSLAGVAAIDAAIKEKDLLKLLSGVGAIAGATGDDSLQKTLDAIVKAGTALGNKDYLALVEVVLSNVDGISDKDALKKLEQFKSLMKLEEAIGDKDLHAALVALEGSGIAPGSFPHFEAQSVAVAIEAIESGDPAKIATAMMMAAASYKHDPEKREAFLEAAAAANDGNYAPLLELFAGSAVVGASPEFQTRVEQLSDLTQMYNAAKSGDADTLKALLESQSWMKGHDAGKWADHGVILGKLAQGDTSGALHMIAERFEENGDKEWAKRFKQAALGTDVVNAVRSGDQDALVAALEAYEAIAGDSQLPTVVAALDAARRGDVGGALNLLATAAGVDDRGSARDLRRAALWFDIGEAARDGDMEKVQKILKENRQILGEDNVDVAKLLIAAESGDPVAFLQQLAATGSVSGDLAPRFDQAASLAKMALAIADGDVVGTIDAFREHQEKVGHDLPKRQADALSAAVKAYEEGRNADALFAASTFMTLVGFDNQAKELTKIGNIVALAEAIEGGDKAKIQAALVPVMKDRLNPKRIDAMVEKYESGDKRGALVELAAALDEKGFGTLSTLVLAAAEQVKAKDDDAETSAPAERSAAGEWLSGMSFREQQLVTARLLHQAGEGGEIPKWSPTAAARDASQAMRAIKASLEDNTIGGATGAGGDALVGRGAVTLGGVVLTPEEVQGVVARAEALGGEDALFETLMAVRWEKEFGSLNGKESLSKLDTVVENMGEAERSQLQKQASSIGDIDPDKIGALQNALDIIGLIPGVGEFADALNVGLSLATGDYIGAALSAISMIPFGDAFAKPIKLALRFGDAKAAQTALNAIATNRDKLGAFLDTDMMQRVVTRLEDTITETRDILYLLVEDAPGPEEALENIAKFKATNPSAAASEEFFDSVDTYLQRDVARIQEEIAALDKHRNAAGELFEAHHFQAEYLQAQVDRLVEVAGERGLSLDAALGSPAPFSLTEAIPTTVRKVRPKVDLASGFTRTQKAAGAKLEPKNTQGWLKEPGHGDFYKKGAHVHVPVDGIDVEVTFTGIERADGTIDIQFGIFDQNGPKPSLTQERAAQAAVAQYLMENVNYRNKMIDDLKVAIKQVGDIEGQIEGAEILLEILQNLS